MELRQSNGSGGLTAEGVDRDPSGQRRHGEADYRKSAERMGRWLANERDELDRVVVRSCN